LNRSHEYERKLMEDKDTHVKEIAMPPLPEEESAPEVTVDNTSTVEPQALEEPAQTETDSAPEKTNKEVNMIVLREQKERLEREHAIALEKLKKYEQKQPEPPQQKEEEEFHINDDDLFEGRHFKKLQKQMKKQEDTLRKYQQQVEATTTETKLRQQYQDFDKVLTSDNIAKLREAEPELASTIAATNDVYAKAVAAYKMIKQMGIYVEDHYNKDREMAQKNSLKPKPVASVGAQRGDTPLTRANAFANGLTKDLKNQLWKEMQDSMK